MCDSGLARAVLQVYPQFLYRNPKNINPFQMIVGSTSYADEQLVPPSPFGSDVVTDLNAFYQTIQEDWPGVNVNRVKNAYSPQNHYGGSVMNAQSQYEGVRLFAFIECLMSGTVLCLTNSSSSLPLLPQHRTYKASVIHVSLLRIYLRVSTAEYTYINMVPWQATML